MSCLGGSIVCAGAASHVFFPATGQLTAREAWAREVHLARRTQLRRRVGARQTAWLRPGQLKRSNVLQLVALGFVSVVKRVDVKGLTTFHNQNTSQSSRSLPSVVFDGF